MTTPIFPALIGLAWGTKRTPTWSTTIQKAASGKRTAIANWTYPIYVWELAFELLQAGGARQDFQALMGFFNQMQGQFGTFLYQDADDNQVAGQTIGVGDGATTAFQLVRAMGYVEPIFAPNVVTTVTVNGAALPGTAWSVGAWGSASPGIVTLTAAPAVGALITADFSFYFPCAFTDDTLTLERFLYQLYQAQKVAFTSLK